MTSAFRIRARAIANFNNRTGHDVPRAAASTTRSAISGVHRRLRRVILPPLKGRYGTGPIEPGSQRRRQSSVCREVHRRPTQFPCVRAPHDVLRGQWTSAAVRRGRFCNATKRSINEHGRGTSGNEDRAGRAIPGVKAAVTRSMRWWVLALAAIAVSSSLVRRRRDREDRRTLHRQRGYQSTAGHAQRPVIHNSNVGASACLMKGMLIGPRFGPGPGLRSGQGRRWRVGRALTAIGEPYELMVAALHIRAISEGAIFIGSWLDWRPWFPRNAIALATALYKSCPRRVHDAVDTRRPGPIHL